MFALSRTYSHMETGEKLYFLYLVDFVASVLLEAGLFKLSALIKSTCS